MRNPESSSPLSHVHDVRRRGNGLACDIDYKTNRLTIAADATGTDMVVVAIIGDSGKMPTIEELQDELPETFREMQKKFEQFKETTN